MLLPAKRASETACGTAIVAFGTRIGTGAQTFRYKNRLCDVGDVLDALITWCLHLILVNLAELMALNKMELLKVLKEWLSHLRLGCLRRNHPAIVSETPNEFRGRRGLRRSGDSLLV